MVFIECCDRYFVLASQSRIVVFNFNVHNLDDQVSSFELKLPEIDKNNKFNNPSVSEDNPTCGLFSNDNTLFAVSDVYKRLIIWKTNDDSHSNNDRSWEIRQNFNSEKKVVQLCFVNDNSLLVGDKSCDIYKYDLQTGECRLLFGHMSLLLRMRLCPQEKFIVTCDRDEKVRVTNYPSVYNIQTFLLGHREFVSSCAFIDHSRIVTGSGDSTIKLWNMINGEELFTFDLRTCFGDDRIRADNGTAASEVNNELDHTTGEYDSQAANKHTTKQTAKHTETRLAIKSVHYDTQSNRLVVIFFNSPNLVTFAVDGASLKMDQIVELPSLVLDAIEYRNRLYLLTVHDGLISYEWKESQLSRVHNRFLASINANQELFKFNEKALVVDYLNGLFKFTHIDSDRQLGSEEKRKRRKLNEKIMA